MCARLKVHVTADEELTSIPFPELPSNITQGFVLIPSPIILLSLLLSLCILYCMCVQGHRDACSAPLSRLCSKFTPSCPYSFSQFLPCSFVYVCSAGLKKVEQGLALFLAHSAIRRLKGILPSLLLHSPRLFFKAWKTVTLTLVPVNLCWESSAGFFSNTEKLGLNDACFRQLKIT